jgi:hypothetical protein
MAIRPNMGAVNPYRDRNQPYDALGQGEQFMGMLGTEEVRQRRTSENERIDAGRAEYEAAQGDRAKMIEVMNKYPELAEEARANMKFQTAETEENHFQIYRGVAEAKTQEEAIRLIQERVRQIEAAGGDPTDTLEDLAELQAGPMRSEDWQNMGRHEIQGHETGMQYLQDQQALNKEQSGTGQELADLERRRDAAQASGDTNMAGRYQNAIDKVLESSGPDTPASQVAFEAMIQGLSPEDQEKARRVNLGLDARAVKRGDSVAMVGNVPYLVTTDPKTDAVTVKPMSLETGEVLDAEAVAQNKGTVASGEAAGKAAQAASTESLAQMNALRQNFPIYDEAIAAIDSGAVTGPIANMFPSITNASVLLENTKNRLGLQVIAGASFGALSAGEMKLALNTALPDLKGPELREYLVKKRAAQEKLANEFEEAAIYMGKPGNTASGYQEMRRNARQQQEEQTQMSVQEILDAQNQSAPGS